MFDFSFFIVGKGWLKGIGYMEEPLFDALILL